MALVLNGSSQHFSIAAAIVAALTGDWTAVIWFQSSALTGRMTVGGPIRNTSFRRSYGPEVRGDQANDPIQFNAYGGSDSWSAPLENAVQDEWHCAVWSNLDTGDVMDCYELDGDPITRPWPNGTSITSALTQWLFGAALSSGTYSNFFNGKMAHLAVYDSVLTKAQIASLYAGTAPNDIGVTPVYYAPLISDATLTFGSTAITLTGSPTFDSDSPFATGPTIGTVGGDDIIVQGETGVTFQTTNATGTVTAVSINGVAQTVTSDVDAGGGTRNVTITVNPSTPTGSQTMTVNYSDGSSATRALQVGAPASTVAITSVDLDNALTQGQVGVIVYGSGFGPTQSTSTITVNSVAYTPTSWAADEIAITLPPSLLTTPFDIVVTVGGDFDSQSVTLTVTHPYVAPQGSVDSNSICPSPITWPAGTYLNLPALPSGVSFKSPYTSWADVVAANLLTNNVADYLTSETLGDYVLAIGVLAPNTAPSSYNITVTVHAPILAPTLSSPIPNVTTKEQSGTVNLDVSTHFTSTGLTFGVTGLPASTGLSFNTSTGVLSGTVAAADIAASPYNLTFTATNVTGSASDIATITVDRIPTLTLSAGTISTKEGTPASVTVTTSDAVDGTTPVTITNLGSLHSGHGVSLTGSTLTVSGTAADGTTGSFSINLSTTDSAGNTVTDSVSVTVIGFPLTAPIGTVSGRSMFQGATYPSGTKFRFVSAPTHFSFTDSLETTDWSLALPLLGTWDSHISPEVFSVELKTPANQYGTFTVTLDPNDPELREYTYAPGDNLVYSLAESQFYRIDNQTAVSSVNTKTGHVVITLSELGGAPLNHTHAAATTSTSGFMSAADKTKLDGISSGATTDPATLLTAIKTVDGAGSGLDADLLDGQSGAFYQSASNLNAGTVPVARLPAASTSAVGAVQLSSSTSSTSEALAATAYAVKLAYDVGNHAHPYLASGGTAVNSLALNGQAQAFYTNASNLSSGTIPVARLPLASTAAVGAVQLIDSIASASTTLAATASAVKYAYDIGNHAHPYLPTSGKAADSALLNGRWNTTSPAGDTIAERDGAADIHARLFRSNYPAQTSAAGAGAAVCFRNDTADNYMRFMDKTSFESWLSLAYANKTTTGFIRATGDIIWFYSDERLKFIKGRISSALYSVLGMRGIVYTANDLGAKYGFDKDKVEVGLCASDAMTFMPEIVAPAPFDTDDNGNSISGQNYKTLRYERVVPYLVEAIRELHQEITALKSRKVPLYRRIIERFFQ